MKNVTITLQEEVADWLRIEAAKAGMSMSAFVSDLLEARMGRGKDQIAALETFLSGSGFTGISADLPKREEIYDRAALDRHQYFDSRTGSSGSEKTKHFSGFTETSDQQPNFGPEPPKSE